MPGLAPGATEFVSFGPLFSFFRQSSLKLQSWTWQYADFHIIAVKRKRSDVECSRHLVTNITEMILCYEPHPFLPYPLVPSLQFCAVLPATWLSLLYFVRRYSSLPDILAYRLALLASELSTHVSNTAMQARYLQEVLFRLSESRKMLIWNLKVGQNRFLSNSPQLIIKNPCHSKLCKFGRTCLNKAQVLVSRQGARGRSWRPRSQKRRLYELCLRQWTVFNITS
jgi:hypothetical protein